MIDKDIKYGCDYQTGHTLEESIDLLDKEVKEISISINQLEMSMPSYPILPEMRGDLLYLTRILHWLKELKSYRDANRSNDTEEDIEDDTKI